MTEQGKPQQAQGQGPKRKPGWMSIPGGPKEPSFQDYHTSLKALSAKKSKLFERLAEIREELGGGKSDEDQAVKEERMQLAARMKEIESERKKQRAIQEEKFSERQSVAQERNALKKQVEELTADLGIFKSLDDIEEAIDRVLIHMETGSGTLKSEKKTLKRVGQLEKAKGLLLKLRPMQERIAEAEAQERELRDEHEEIRNRIKTLDSQFTTVAEQKNATMKNVKKAQADRTKLIEERTAIRDQLTAINDEITQLRTGFDEARAAWNEWKEKAMTIYKEQREAAQREYEAKRAEAEKKRKEEAKAARALRRLNPYANEIDACNGLIRYLEEKTNAHKRDKEKLEHDKKLAAFNPSALAPTGFSVRSEDDDWVFQDRTKKNQKQKSQKKETPSTESQGAKPREKLITHSFDRLRSFELVGIERPLSMAQVASTIEAIKAKKKEYESHIKTGDDVPSSDDEAEEQEQAVEQEQEQAVVPANDEGEAVAPAAAE